MKISLLAIVILMFSCQFALSQTLTECRIESDKNHTRYDERIKSIIPEGWKCGDLVEVKLKNEQDALEDLLGAIIFYKNEELNKHLAKILLITKKNNVYKILWESKEHLSGPRPSRVK